MSNVVSVWQVIVERLEKANQEFCRAVDNTGAFGWTHKKSVSYGKVLGICGVLVNVRDRIPHGWKIRIIANLEELGSKIPWSSSDRHWFRSRSSILATVRKLKEEPKR